ncbi:MAG: hypothetical protein GC154_10495 [bacterium]|nr:hypothetical protein [bacterium]
MNRYGMGAAAARGFIATLVIAISLCSPPITHAGLLNRLGSQSARGLSMSGAGDVTGLHAGPINAALNPAALSTVDGLELYLGDVSVWTDFSYDQAPLLGGTHFEAKDEIFQFPEAALAYRLDDRWVIGFALWAPYGLSADFRDASLTFPGYNTELADIELSLAASYQVSEDVSVGASLNVDYLDLHFRLPVVVGGTFLGHNVGDADGFGVGGALGVLWTPDRWRLGVKYSFPVDVDMDGSTTLPPLLGLPRDDFSAKIHVPQRIAAGVAYEITDWWTAAFDATYTDYGENNNFTFDFDRIPSAGLPLDWGSIWSFHAGSMFRVTDKLTWMQGAGWLSSGMPDYSMIPSIPDTPGWIVSTGVEYRFCDSFSLDAGMAYAWGDRNIGFDPSRPSAGDIHSDIWLANIGFNFHF